MAEKRVSPLDLAKESMGEAGCRRWIGALGFLDGFLDAHMILTISMMCKKLHGVRWRLENQNWGEEDWRHKAAGEEEEVAEEVEDSCEGVSVVVGGGGTGAPRQPALAPATPALRGRAAGARGAADGAASVVAHPPYTSVQQFLDDPPTYLARLERQGGHPPARKPRLLSFSQFCGYDPSALMERYIRAVLALVDPQARADGVVLDLSHCSLIKDNHLVHLVANDSLFVPSPKTAGGHPKAKLVGIKIDFCNLITDKGLAALLSTHLPHLKLLSMRCVRSEQFTGSPFGQVFSQDLWPKIRYVLVDHSSVTLDACQALVDSLAQRRERIADEPGDVCPRCGAIACAGCGTASTLDHDSAWFSFVGSQASKSYFEAIGAKHLIARLHQALNSGDPAEIFALRDAADDESLLVSSTLGDFVAGLGGKYIMNLPVTCPTSEEGGVNVWTLPISLAIFNGDAQFVEALVECGADINVVDHLGKSPLYRTVSSGNIEVCRYLLRMGVDLTPLNITFPTALNAAVMSKNVELTQLLISHGYPINLRCPGWKSFKSPLLVAVECGNERIIHDLLDWGADPNCYSGSYKNSAVMMAYKSEPRLLRLFIHNLRFRNKGLAAEVFAAAIARDDLRTVELILDSFPPLLEREHPTWSYPHIQAAKTGRHRILSYLLRTFVLKTAGSEEPPVRRTFPSCAKHSQEEVNSSMDLVQNREPLSEIFPQSSPAKLSRHPSKGSVDDSNRPTVPVRHRIKNRFWSKPSTAEAQSLKFLPVESDDTMVQHWNESIAHSFIKTGTTASRYSSFLNAADQNTGNTALHYAAESGQIECLKILLREGCDVDVQNDQQETPLHLACRENEIEVVAYLLCTGSDFLNTYDEEGKSPLLTSIRTRNDKVALLIIQFWRMCRKQCVEVARSGRYDDMSSSNQLLNVSGSGQLYHPGPLDTALEYGRYEVAAQLLRFDNITAVLTDDPERQKEVVKNATQLVPKSTSPLMTKVLKRFLAAYESVYEHQRLAEPTTDADDEDTIDQLWYDLCLACEDRAPIRPQPAPAVASSDLAAAPPQDQGESRARRFQAKLRLAAKKPLLLFSNRHRAAD